MESLALLEEQRQGVRKRFKEQPAIQFSDDERLLQRGREALLFIRAHWGIPHGSGPAACAQRAPHAPGLRLLAEQLAARQRACNARLTALGPHTEQCCAQICAPDASEVECMVALQRQARIEHMRAHCTEALEMAAEALDVHKALRPALFGADARTLRSLSGLVACCPAPGLPDAPPPECDAPEAPVAEEAAEIHAAVLKLKELTAQPAGTENPVQSLCGRPEGEPRSARLLEWRSLLEKLHVTDRQCLADALYSWCTSPGQCSAPYPIIGLMLQW